MQMSMNNPSPPTTTNKHINYKNLKSLKYQFNIKIYGIHKRQKLGTLKTF